MSIAILLGLMGCLPYLSYMAGRRHGNSVIVAMQTEPTVGEKLDQGIRLLGVIGLTALCLACGLLVLNHLRISGLDYQRSGLVIMLVLIALGLTQGCSAAKK